MNPLIRQKNNAPSRLRKVPDIFCFTFTILRSRSARLFVNGMLKSYIKAKILDRYSFNLVFNYFYVIFLQNAEQIRFTTKIEKLNSLLENSLTIDLWQYDTSNINNKLNVYLQNPEIYAIDVYDNVSNNTFSVSKQHSVKNLIEYEIILKNENELIGKLTINYSNDEIFLNTRNYTNYMMILTFFPQFEITVLFEDISILLQKRQNHHINFLPDITE